MKVELLKTREKLRAELEAAENSTVVAQQIAYIAAIDSLARLIYDGCTEAHARWMISELRANLDVAREIASTRRDCLLDLPETE